MTMNLLYIAGAIACLLVGGGVAYACWALAKVLEAVRLETLPQTQQSLVEAQHTLADLRQKTLPQVSASLQEVQTNLVHTAEVAKGVAESVNTANETANKALDSVGSSLEAASAGFHKAGESLGTAAGAVSAQAESLKQNVGIPAWIRARSAYEGLMAGYRAIREPKVKSVIMTPEAVLEEGTGDTTIIRP